MLSGIFDFFYSVVLNVSYATVISNIIPTAKYDTYKVIYLCLAEEGNSGLKQLNEVNEAIQIKH